MKIIFIGLNHVAATSKNTKVMMVDGKSPMINMFNKD